MTFRNIYDLSATTTVKIQRSSSPRPLSSLMGLCSPEIAHLLSKVLVSLYIRIKHQLVHKLANTSSVCYV